METVLEKQALHCKHCGSACPPTPVKKADENFCCDGCATVYSLLKENDLCYYYQLNEAPGKPADTQTDLNYLDDPEIIKQLLDFQDETLSVVTFEIPALHCSACLWLLENLYKIHKGIRSSEVNFLRKELYITFNHQETTLKQIIQLLYRVGYPPRLSLEKLAPYKKSTKDPALQRLTYQLGVAGFCFGNIMLLSFPDYLGVVDEKLLQVFNYLNLLLGLPLFFYACQDYFRTAWQGLKMRRLVIEQPLAIGMASMFFRSGYEILSHTGTGFLDSLAGLTFFLLVGKFIQYKNYSFLSFERDYRAYFPLSVLKRQSDGNLQSVAVAGLQVGDTIFIRHNEIIPADSVLLDGNTQIDYSFLTGEALPIKVQKGQTLYAGGRNVGNAVELLIAEKVTQSKLTRMWDHPAFQKDKPTELNIIINKINQYFTPIVLVLATISGLYWLPQDMGRAMAAFTAVLIIACPCALVLASPFTYGHITRIFGKHGFYLRNANVVEHLAYIDTIVFDKTGTLTEPNTAQVDFHPQNNPLSEAEYLAVAGLFQQSLHPLAQSIVQYFNIVAQDLPTLQNYTEVPAKGMRAEVNGLRIAVGAAEWVGLNPSLAPQHTTSSHTTSGVHLCINDEYRGYFAVHQAYRSGIGQMIAGLKPAYRFCILSGDKDYERENLIKLFGQGVNMHFQQSPQDKLDKIVQLQAEQQRVMMVGDGLNDAGALRQSEIGISITEDQASFSPASDVILDAKAITRLPNFLALARDSKTVIKICFAVSLTYNFTGTYFAVQGALSPVIAAVLMPFSSIGIISVATGLTYYYANKANLLRPETK